jgi:hypothetical protein
MNDKISISIDVSKVQKAKFQERRYFNKENKEVVITELKLDVIPLREAKLLKDGDIYQLWKTHFVAYPQTKEEREAKEKSVIIGDGIMFKNKVQEITYPDDGVNPEDVPF